MDTTTRQTRPDAPEGTENPPHTRPKGQSRLHSFIESILNIVIGFGVAIGAQLAIFPLFGIQISLSQNLGIGFLFTLVSLMRSYALRRFFNFLHIRGF